MQTKKGKTTTTVEVTRETPKKEMTGAEIYLKLLLGI
jgi:hypothetical protein